MLLAFLLLAGGKALGQTFTEGFESDISSRWTITHNDTDYNRWIWARTTSKKHAGSYCLGAPNAFGPTFKITDAKIQMDFSSFSNIKLSFYYINPSMSSYPYTYFDKLSVVAVSANESETVVWSSSSYKNSWAQVSNINIPAGTKYIVFRAKNDQGGGIYIDDITITYSCSTPTLSLSSLANQTVCLGNSVTLNPAPSSNGTVSYRWNNGSTSSTLLASSAGAYSVTVTSTIGTCSTSRSSSATITVNTPNIENVSSYDYIWKGNTANWNTASNWYVYSNGYSVASSVPTIDKNIYIGSSQCVGSSWPTANSTANAKDITIASGATLTIPASKTLNIAGNITNNGTLTANNSSTIVFKGNNDQILSGTMIFGNVTFNQAGVHKIIASSGITVNNIANFTKGIVVGDMTFYAGATASNVTDSASFVDGKVTKRTGASVETDFIFPTGSATDGQPKVLGSVLVASLSANSETSIVFNQKSNGGGFSDSEMPQFWKPNNCDDNNPLFNHISNFEFWKVNTTSNLTATLKVSADNQNAHFNTAATTSNNDDIYGAIWQGGCWKNVGGSAVISGDRKTITITNVTIPRVSSRAGETEPSWLTMGSKEHETWLPIELTSFTATCNGRSSLIEWTTATEKNNDFFVLERSNDAINFKEIARIAGAGNSIEPISYAYTDYGVRNGDNYYRLIQFDYDGTSTASEIIVANCLGTDGEPEVLAYPNPFGDDITLRFENFGNIQATVEVYDMLGRMVHTQKVNCSQNDYEVVLRLAGLSDGTYNVKISAKEFVLNKKVVKQ